MEWTTRSTFEKSYMIDERSGFESAGTLNEEHVNKTSESATGTHQWVGEEVLAGGRDQ